MVESGTNQVAAFEKSDRLAHFAEIPSESGCEPNALELEQRSHVLHSRHQTLAQHSRMRSAHQHDCGDRSRIRNGGPAYSLDE